MINGIGSSQVLRVDPISVDKKPDNIKRELEVEMKNGELQVKVKDEKGDIIRYIPPLDLNKRIRLELEKRSTIDYYV